MKRMALERTTVREVWLVEANKKLLGSQDRSYNDKRYPLV